MIISKDEIINLFEGVFDQEEQAAEIKRDAVEDLKTYSERNELELKSLKQAYALYKKYRSGKMKVSDDMYFELSSLVEDHFINQKREEE